MDSICHLDIITIYGAVRVMPVNKSSNLKLCGWLFAYLMLVRSLQSICSMSAHRNESIVTSFEPDCNVRMNPFFFWLTSYCKSMSTKIIINTHTHFATKHMLDFVVFLVTWPYFFHQIASIVHFKRAHIFSPIARHEKEREREKQQENQSRLRATAKFHIGKCVFNFLHLLL